MRHMTDGDRIAIGYEMGTGTVAARAKTGRPVFESIEIGDLLRPHWKALAIGLCAVIGEGCADLLQPWPLKVVFDNVLRSGSAHAHGWLNDRIVSIVGTDPLSILKLAALAALAIAVVGALCSYTEKVPHHQRGPMGDARSAPQTLLACATPVALLS